MVKNNKLHDFNIFACSNSNLMLNKKLYAFKVIREITLNLLLNLYLRNNS